MKDRGIVQDCLKYTFFPWGKQAGLNPINAHKGKGVYIWDRDGKRYIDFSSMLMNVNIGHGDTRVRDAVMAQMDEVSYVYPGMVTKARGELGKKLAEVAPKNLKKSFFTLGGAEAVENAVKIARVYTGRHKIIAQYRSFHGATYGCLSVGGDPRKFAMDSQQMPNVVHVENPYFYRCPWGSKTESECSDKSAAALERVIQFENPDSIAAIIFEGESGSSGCIKYPKGYWKRIKTMAEKYGILMIDDEVMSGFGRTGKWFAIEHHGVEPDIMTMAKGITAAYVPLGGLMVSEKIAAYFEDHPFPCGLTAAAHPVSCAAAVATLKVYEEDGLIENAAKMGRYMDKKMAELIQKHPSIGDWRNTGLFGCIELVKNRKTREPIAPWNAKPAESDISNKIAAKIRELGMFTFVRWNWIFVCPPLCINKAEIDEGLEIISRAIEIADQQYQG